jgi:ubiquinone/menaquinone biosynthesis C-methylase UbiE
MRYPPELVLRVNKIFHDIDANQYADEHPEIFVDEIARWCKIGQLFMSSNSEKVCLLDIGSGTGFVPLQIGQFLKKSDLLICSDVSANMLTVCKTNLDSKLNCTIEYLLLDGVRINLMSNSLDYITLNSVLHHIPDFSVFFEEINRLMKVNGWLIIAHEPYRPFFEHRFLWNNYRFVSKIVKFDPKRFIYVRLRKVGIPGIAGKFYQVSSQETERRQEMVESVNKRLLDEEVISSPLTAIEISEIVDIHSPTAGLGHRDRGINIAEILELYLPNFEIEYLEMYRHLAKVTSANQFTKLYDSFLKKLYPETGSTFLAVLSKSGG